MPLITRTVAPNNKNAKLTSIEMDNNLYYLQSLGVSALTFSSNTLTLTNPTGGTISVSGFSGGLPYTIYTALVSLNGTTFTVTQLENTIGDGSNISQYERLRINGNGIACFSCQVCAPNAVINCLGVNAVWNNSGGANQPLQVKFV